MRSEEERYILDVEDSKFERQARRLRLLRNLLIAAFLITLFSSYVVVYKQGHPVNASTQQQIAELIQVQKSLSNLQNYIEQQQKDIKATSEQLDTLSKQKGDVENVLRIDRPKLEALLSSMNQQFTKNRWLEYSLSFLLGVLSSLTAAYGYEWLQKRKSAEITQTEVDDR